MNAVAFTWVVAKAAMLMLEPDANVVESLAGDAVALARGARISAVALLIEMAPPGGPALETLAA